MAERPPFRVRRSLRTLSGPSDARPPVPTHRGGLSPDGVRADHQWVSPSPAASAWSSSRRGLGLLAAVVVAVCLASPATGRADELGCAFGGSDWGTPRPDLAGQVSARLDALRADRGLAPLVADAALTRAALWKSGHMIALGYFAHEDAPTGRSPGDRAAACGYTGAGWGENIASGYATAEAVMGGWTASAGHLANMLGAGYARVGVGASERADGTILWTQVFGSGGADAGPAPAAEPVLRLRRVPPAGAPAVVRGRAVLRRGTRRVVIRPRLVGADAARGRVRIRVLTRPRFGIARVSRGTVVYTARSRTGRLRETLRLALIDADGGATRATIAVIRRA